MAGLLSPDTKLSSLIPWQNISDLSPRWGLCRCLTHARAREREDWGEPPPFWFVRNWGSHKTTKFRSFSLVYL